MDGQEEVKADLRESRPRGIKGCEACRAGCRSASAETASRSPPDNGGAKASAAPAVPERGERGRRLPARCVLKQTRGRQQRLPQRVKERRHNQESRKVLGKEWGHFVLRQERDAK